jgi:hypothetical protein
MTSEKYYLAHPLKLQNWKLLQIFHGSSYFDLKEDFYRIGVNETPILLVFSSQKKFAYLTISRNEIGKIPNLYIGFNLELKIKDEPDLNQSTSYLSSLQISDNTPDSGKLANVLALQRKIEGDLQIAAISFEFWNGKNLYVYDNDLPDGLILEYNSKNWLSNFASRYDL